MLLNKTDLATEAQCAEAKALILRANPAARIRRTQFGRFEPEWLSLIVPDVDVDEVLDMPDITLQKAVLQIRPTMPFTALQKCLVQLAGETWRIKGFVRVPEGIFYVDCTGPEVRLTPWQGEADNRLVLLAGKGMQLRRTARTAVQWYRADPLAPGRYTADYLFASVMAAQPLLWMELSGLGRQDAARLQQIIGVYRLHREAMWACDVRPVGQEPDGRSFTGFAFTSPCGQKGYLLLFRENVPESAFTFTRMPQKARLRLLCANGPVGQGYTPAGDLCLRFAAPRTYAFYQWQT